MVASPPIIDFHAQAFPDPVAARAIPALDAGAEAAILATNGARLPAGSDRKEHTA